MTKDYLFIRAFSHSIHKSKLSAQQTMVLAHLAAHHLDPDDRTARQIAAALGIDDGTVGKKLKSLSRDHDFVDKHPIDRVFFANRRGIAALQTIASEIKAALGLKPRDP